MKDKLKTYASFVKQTEYTQICIIKASNIKEAKEIFKQDFRNVEKVYSYV